MGASELRYSTASDNDSQTGIKHEVQVESGELEESNSTPEASDDSGKNQITTQAEKDPYDIANCSVKIPDITWQNYEYMGGLYAEVRSGATQLTQDVDFYLDYDLPSSLCDGSGHTNGCVLNVTVIGIERDDWNGYYDDNGNYVETDRNGYHGSKMSRAEAQTQQGLYLVI